MAGFSAMINWVCDNTMILDKALAVQLMCLMKRIEIGNFYKVMAEHLNIGSDYFVLDNDGIPHNFKSEYRAGPIHVHPVANPSTVHTR